LDPTNIQNTEIRIERLLFDYIDFTHVISLHFLFKKFSHYSSIEVKVKVRVKVKIKQSRGFQDVEVPRFLDNGTGWW